MFSITRQLLLSFLTGISALILAPIPFETALAEEQEEVAKWIGSDVNTHAYLGYSLDIEGNTAMLGAPFAQSEIGDPPMLVNVGAVYAYARYGTWAYQAKIVANEPDFGSSFGFSVSLDGEFVLVGAPNSDEDGLSSGSAYLFSRLGDSWFQRSKVTASDHVPSLRFGWAVSMDGPFAVIGTSSFNSDDDQKGAAFVFARVGGVLIERAKLTASDGEALDHFGMSVSIDGNIIVVGAQGSNTNTATYGGAAYVFVWDGNDWIQEAKLIPSDVTHAVSFGSSVSVSGDTILIGDHQGYGSEPNSGTAHVFVRGAGGWTEQAKLFVSGSPYFGKSVSLDGDMALIGTDGGATPGSAYVFTRNGENWTEQTNLIASDGANGDQFGNSVGLDDGNALVGAYQNNQGRGAAYLFAVATPVTSPYEHTYYLTSATTWADAEAEAVSHGGHLVTINDLAEQEFINGLLSGSTWIGFTDEGTNVWDWVNGDPVSYTNWSPSEPNGGTSENCAVSEEAWGGLWNDLPCDQVLRGIVELEPDWELVDVRQDIARWSMSMAYDSKREVVVMFGGRSLNSPYNLLSDTWEFDGTSWTQVATDNAPAPRFWHSMAYDSNRERIVLFGGGDRDAGILFAETWEYDGNNWEQKTPTISPPAMDTMSMTFDSHSSAIVLFGGTTLSDELNGTWEYDGSDWSEVSTPTSPPRGTLAAMAFDSVRNRVVLFGLGVVDEPTTWEYDGVNWSLMSTPTSPPGRWAHAMVYDSARQRMVLFGGYGPTLGSQLDDTWVYDGLDWKQINTDNAPAPREQHGMAYDAARKRVVLFGGIGGSNGGDTWEYVDELSPLEQVDNTLRLIDYAVADGSLEGSGSGSSANGRLSALINMIEYAGELIDNGFTADACEQLHNAGLRTDGQHPPPDFVTGPAAVELEQLIRDMQVSLDCSPDP